MIVATLPPVESRRPQILRQLDFLRSVFLRIGVSVLFFSCIVLFARLDYDASDLTAVLTAPILAVVGMFPFTTPVCLFLIEALATSRILTCYHPMAALRRQEIPSEDTNNSGMLLLRYFFATISNRLALQDTGRSLHRMMCFLYRFFGANGDLQVGPRIVRIPPASLNLLEKLGVATALTLVDDELVCEPHALPQQLLIPSGKGLKLLDICPTYEGESDDDGESDQHGSRRSIDGDFHDSDSESDDGFEYHHHAPNRRKRRRLKSARKDSLRNKSSEDETKGMDTVDHAVEFEDPLWWHFLPSLKCIGLACLIVDQKDEITNLGVSSSLVNETGSYAANIEEELISLICSERRSMQLRSLAQCIGFSKEDDLTSFVEKYRLHVINTARLKERLEIDSHERGLEESRWWGLLRPDSTSVIVQDARSGAYQLVTVGDPRV